MEDGDGDPNSVLSPPNSLLCFESSDSLNPSTTTSDSFSDHQNQDHDQTPFQEINFTQEFTLSREDFNPREADEYARVMLERENIFRFGVSGDVSDNAARWMKSERLESIQWIRERRVRLGFRSTTAYLSIMYFDRFLSAEFEALRGRDWAMRLLAVTCLSLAAKMEEVRVPALSVLGASCPRFDFSKDMIMKMEIMVLSVLQWEMGLVSPFCFMHFFLRKFRAFPADGGDHGGGVVEVAAGIIFESVKVASTMDFRPSVVGAAAALAATDRGLTKEAVVAELSRSSVSDYRFTLSIEQVHSCYELIKELYPSNKVNEPKSPDRQDPGSSSPSSGASDKRRRLGSDGSGHAI